MPWEGKDFRMAETYDGRSASIIARDDNIDEIRAKFPNGLHFVVGDLHGERETLRLLLQKIRFDPQKDCVFFVGDYNAGGNPRALLSLLSKHFTEGYDQPGFHLIRGNHERELCPQYTLENLPDVIVFKSPVMQYYIVHAGMVAKAFDLINWDMENEPERKVFAYRLDDSCAAYDKPLRQLIWSRRGLYSQRSRWHSWPSEEELREHSACIIHGHTPYCFFSPKTYSTYGDLSLVWQNQRVWFSEDLQSFNIDSNVKGRYENGESYRGLSCICLEVLDEIASASGGTLRRDELQRGPNAVFSVAYAPNAPFYYGTDISPLLDARPPMKTIALDPDGFLTLT